jgi:hypothetical protein
MKNQSNREIVDQIVERELERRRRLAVALAAEQALLPDERAQFLAGQIIDLDSSATTEGLAVEGRRRRRPVASEPMGSVGTNPTATIRTLISTVLAGNGALESADVCRAVLAIDPDRRRTSVASELTAMRAAGLVTKRGSGARGGLYGLVQAPANDNSGAPEIK